MALDGGVGGGADGSMRPAKRGNGAIDTNPVSHREMGDFMAEFEVSQKQMLETQLGELKTTINESVTGLIDRSQAATVANQRALQAKTFEYIDAQVGPLRDAQADLQSKHDQLCAKHDMLETTVNDMRSRMALAEAQPTRVAQLLEEENFVRDPIPSRLKVNAAEPLSNASVKLAVSTWLEAADLPESNWEFSGPALGMRFFVDFKGDPLTAARKAKKANLALRRPSGIWENPEALNAANAKVCLYVGPDKSPQQEAQEAMGKRLLRVVKDLHPAVEFSFDKKRSLIQAKVGTERKDFAVLVAKSAEDKAPKFWTPTLLELDFSKEAILEKMESSARGHVDPENSNWAF